jgi:flagellar motor protein MotB
MSPFPPARLLALPFLFLLAPGSVTADTSAEKIFFIKPDGFTYLNYSTTRSDHPNYSLFLKEDESEATFDYIYPNQYRLDVSAEAGRKVILFDQGSYATLRPGRFEERVTVSKDGIYTFRNWDKEKNPELPGGYFGEWTAPDNFSQYVCVWVFPDNLEIVSFEANQPEEKGVWKPRGNTLAWFGEDVNNIVFTIQYRPKTSRTAELVRSALASGDAPVTAEVLAGERDVRVVLPDESLFPPGSVTLSDSGQTVLARLAIALKDHPEAEFIVEGHTDNTPLSGALAERYATNWGLSSARSLSVVRFFEQSGIAGARLESRAFGDHRPVAPNDTPEGRAKNRRIEIRISTSR